MNKMNTAINDGGPAFPVPDSHHANGQVQYGANGMTLRDWFASQALEDDISEHAGGWLVKSSKWEFTREQAKYRYADAMLAARLEGKQ